MKQFTVLILVLIHLSGYSQNNEKILFNGTIITINEAQPKVEAVAIVNDKIVAVGKLGEVKKKVSTKAELIDLQGKYLLPGLIDSHNHALNGGETLMAAMLNDVLLSKDELKAFAQQTLSTKKGMRGDVLYIGGVHSGTWAASNDLHDLFNNEPYLSQAVVLRGSDGHTAWVNKVMMQRAKIDRDFIRSLSAVDRKYFGTDVNDNPNGLISEDGFQKIRTILPASTIDLRTGGEAGIKYLNSLGITAWLDPSAGDITEGEHNGELNVYKQLAKENKLKAHVVAVVVGEGDGDAMVQINTLKKLQQQFRGVKDVDVIGFKIFADGVLEYPTQTGAISIPYKNSGSMGSLMFDPEKFKKFVTLADKEKLLVHIHAIGDRAVTESLNAYSAARKANGNSGVVHSITHLQLVKQQDYKRFAELNVMPSVQMLWHTEDIYTMELVKPYIDSLLSDFQYPLFSLVKAGATIAGASDWPVSSANPFEAIHMKETGRPLIGSNDVDYVMRRKYLLEAYTINAAKLLMLEKSIGSIEPGKQADFILVDRDVTSVSSAEVKSTQVLWTMFGGEVVHKK